MLARSCAVAAVLFAMLGCGSGSADAAPTDASAADAPTPPGEAGVDAATLDASVDGDAASTIDGAPPSQPDFTSLATNDDTFCGVDASGDVWCWGVNAYGQAGQAPGTAVSSPSRVAGLSQVVSVTVGGRHACAVTAAHAVYCWGSNDFYQLGAPPSGGCPGAGGAGDAGDADGSSDAGSAPGCTSVPTLVAAAPAVAVSAMNGWTCIAGVDGSIQCWGQVLTATSPLGAVPCAMGALCVPAPTTVPGVTGATDIATGNYHTCAIVAGGRVACWGSNYFDQVSATPCASQDDCPATTRTDVSGATQLSAGMFATCVRTAAGVQCVGCNDDAQLGHPPHTQGDVACGGGGQSQCAAAAVAVPDAAHADAVSESANSGCALSQGKVLCWGWAGATILGSPTDVGFPAMKLIGRSSGAGVCGVAVDGNVWCWNAGKTAPP